jgi:hypothetical protein
LSYTLAQKCSINGLVKNVLYSGKGLGSYYYDAFGGLCPLEKVPYPENQGIASCESYFAGPNQVPISAHKNNNLIAIDNTLLQQPGGRAKFCGKRVIVRYNGVLVDKPFIVWDGCGACLNGARLDFSREALMDIDPQACDLGLLPEISWKVVDEQLMTFVP